MPCTATRCGPIPSLTASPPPASRQRRRRALPRRRPRRRLDRQHDREAGRSAVRDASSSTARSGKGLAVRRAFPPTRRLENAGGTIHRAPTLAALAEKAGVPAAATWKRRSLLTTHAVHSKTFAASSPARTLETIHAVGLSRRRRSSPSRSAPASPTRWAAFASMAMRACCATMAASSRDYMRPARRRAASKAASPPAYLGGLTKAGVQGLCAAEHIARTLTS